MNVDDRPASSQQPRRLRCPSCGTTADEFGFVQSYRSTGTGLVRVSEDDGTLLVDWLDAGQPERFSTPEIECPDCGHRWRTARAWRSVH